MKIQECVFDKIEDAYNEFKEEMLKEDPEEIFEKAYKISIIGHASIIHLRGMKSSTWMKCRRDMIIR